MNHLKEHIAFWEFINQCLVQNLPCMLLLVVDHRGSSPGRTGFKMGINAAGEMRGSIGGGVMEHKLVELSKKWLAAGKQVIELKRQVHKAEVGKDRSGMICSGEQQVAMISLNKQTQGLVASIITSLQNQSSQYLRLSNQGLQLTNAAAGRGLQYVSEEEWAYEEELGGACSLHIIGGGHISLALSKLGSELGFQVIVYDHREQLHTIEENSYAEVRLTDYDQLSKLIPSGETEMVVIMTVGYRTDKLALLSVIDGQYAYLGMLGSNAKIAAMFEELQQEGYSKEQLARIDAPAGIPINSQTPGEIAVSIGARLIQARWQSN